MIVKTTHSQEYLCRYFILKTKWQRIYLHRIESSDAGPCMHNHPWWFLSIILRGGCTEHVPHDIFNRRPGQFTYLPVGILHHQELSKPAWSILIGGPVTRAWGFMTPSGWRLFERHNKSQKTAVTVAPKILNPELGNRRGKNSLQWDRP